MKSVKAQLVMLFNMLLPIKKNTVLFRSFFGQYNDNPKYISEELHRRFPNVKIIWAIQDGKEREFPPYVELVELGSEKYIQYTARAHAVVDNYSGCRSSILTEKSFLTRALVAFKSRKRKKQLNISTWHGTPLKHIAMDEPAYKQKEFVKAYLNTNILIAGNTLTADAFTTALSWKQPIMMCGTPRNDILFDSNDDTINKLKIKAGVPTDKKVILFAPTFRNDLLLSGISQVKEMELDRLFASLRNKFGGDWVFIFRSHNLVMNEIEKNNADFDSRIINGNLNPDMAEYLAITDVLITDYSSSMFDFMLTGKPCFLLTPDLENYRNSERGFYFDIEKVPFGFSMNFDELINDIQAFDNTAYGTRITAFLDWLGNVENGTASCEIVNKIGDFMKLN